MKKLIKRFIFIVLMTVSPCTLLFSFDAAIDGTFFYDINAQNPFYQKGILDVGHTDDFIDLFWSFSVCNDDKYQSSHGDEHFLGYYFFLENAGISLNRENLNLTIGRTVMDDAVDSPYSLFVSSRIIPALLADFTYDDGTFFFTSRWTELNRDSALGFPDRGWQYNTYGLYLGDFRIGFQDSLIYKETSFDPEYFLDPLPGFFKQYVRISAGKPWTVTGDANSIMGFFAEWRPENLYTYGQLLIDDLNANALLNPDSYQNPNKIAWSAGGRYEFDFGRLGFYTAGATKYTFQSSGSPTADYKYGYSFYPAATYTANGVEMPILFEDNYIGYYNGENSLSFLADYSGDFYDIDIYSTLELSISGDKSPANPWSEYTWWTDEPEPGTHFLDQGTLEKKLILSASASRALPELGLDNLRVAASLTVGYIWNVLQLTDIPAELVGTVPGVNDIRYWTPSQNNKAVFAVSIGARYSL